MVDPDIGEYKIERNENSDGAAMARQPALPYCEDFPGMLQVILGLVEEAMSQTRPDQRTSDHVEEKTVQAIFGFLFNTKLPTDHEVADVEPQGEEQPIPTDHEGTEPKQLRTHIPIYVREQIDRHKYGVRPWFSSAELHPRQLRQRTLL